MSEMQFVTTWICYQHLYLRSFDLKRWQMAKYLGVRKTSPSQKFQWENYRNRDKLDASNTHIHDGSLSNKKRW